jgi:biotin-(acetyl-CoA carboxylase) ligase
MPSSLATPLRPELDLPPGFTLCLPRPAGDAFGHACRGAARGQAGALVWSTRPDLVDLALVLEPEEPLRTARRAFIAGMSALADAVGSCAPPEKPVTLEWPDTLCFDEARLGGGRLAWPEGCGEGEEPDWLVFGATLIASKAAAGDPGLTPHSTSLEEEGFEPEDRDRMVEAFARQLLRALDLWSERGFPAVADAYLHRMARDVLPGNRGIEDNGDLLTRVDGTGDPERRSLVAGLRESAWLDPATGTPRL